MLLGRQAGKQAPCTHKSRSAARNIEYLQCSPAKLLQGFTGPLNLFGLKPVATVDTVAKFASKGRNIMRKSITPKKEAPHPLLSDARL
jgi:hypothetical protein